MGSLKQGDKIMKNGGFSRRGFVKSLFTLPAIVAVVALEKEKVNPMKTKQEESFIDCSNHVTRPFPVRPWEKIEVGDLVSIKDGAVKSVRSGKDATSVVTGFSGQNEALVYSL